MSETRAFPTCAIMSSAVPPGRRGGPLRARRRRDSLRLHAIAAGLAIRDDGREEVIDNLRL
jgi:hypothetical protein